MKSQAALEYILVVGITFVIIVPTSYLFYNYSKESTEELKDAQITQIGTTIIDLSHSIYYSGEGSKSVLKLNMPDNVNGVKIVDSRELVFNATTNSGSSDIVFFSSNYIPIATKKNGSCFGELCELCAESECKVFSLENSGLKSVKISAAKRSDNLNVIKIEVVG